MQRAPENPLEANYAQVIKEFNSIDQIITSSRSYCLQDARPAPLRIVIAGTVSVILAQGPKEPSKDQPRLIGHTEVAFGSTADRKDFEDGTLISKIALWYLPFSFDGLSEDPEQNALIYQHTVGRPSCLLWSGAVLQIYAVEWDMQLARRIRVAAAWRHGPHGHLRSISERTKEEICRDLDIRQALDVVMHVGHIRRQEGRLMFPTRAPSGLYKEEVLLKKEDVEYLQAAWEALFQQPAFFGYDGCVRI